MLESDFKATQKQKKDLVDLYEECKKRTKDKRSVAEQENKEDKTKSNNEMFDIDRMKAREIIPNEIDLTNTLIEMSYKSTKISRAFTWALVGDVILNNLLNQYYTTQQ